MKGLKSTIPHIKKIFKEGELLRDAVVAYFATAQDKGEDAYLKNIKDAAGKAKKKAREIRGK